MTVDGFQATYDFYKSAFNRNSSDDKGMKIRASIHLKRGLDNAFWNGVKKQMVFGDGGRFDGRGWLLPSPQELATERSNPALFKAQGWATMSNWLDNYDLDTIAHELTHGVVQHTAALSAEVEGHAAGSEANTLNEHIADCFGIMLRHFVNKQTAETGNWDFSPNV